MFSWVWARLAALQPEVSELALRAFPVSLSGFISIVPGHSQ